MISIAVFLVNLVLFSEINAKCKYKYKVDVTKLEFTSKTGEQTFEGCGKGCYLSSGSSDNIECKKCKDAKEEDVCEPRGGPEGCYWKDGKCKSFDCPKHYEEYKNSSKEEKEETKKEYKELLKKDKEVKKAYKKFLQSACNKASGCLTVYPQMRCSAFSIWAFIVILVVGILVVIAIIAVIVFLILKLSGGGNKTSQVTPANSIDAPQPANEDGTTSDKAVHDKPVEGPYVVIKMGDKEMSTKKVASASVLTWGETVVFDSLGNEDEDATFELRGSNSDGTHTLRILDYVSNKQRVSLPLKNNEGADVGVLEVDIEIKEEMPPKAVYFVDKYNGPGSVIQKE